MPSCVLRMTTEREWGESEVAESAEFFGGGGACYYYGAVGQALCRSFGLPMLGRHVRSFQTKPRAQSPDQHTPASDHPRVRACQKLVDRRCHRRDAPCWVFQLPHAGSRQRLSLYRNRKCTFENHLAGSSNTGKNKRPLRVANPLEVFCFSCFFVALSMNNTCSACPGRV